MTEPQLPPQTAPMIPPPAQPQFVPPKVFTPPQKGEIITWNNCNYYLGDQIDQGAFGAVYECTDDWDNLLVAKVLLPQNRPYEAVRHDWMHELQVLSQLRHPNITFIHAAFECRDTFYLIVERCAYTLKDLISSANVSPEIWMPYVARDVLHAMEFIHGHAFVHKDLHPGNVFISQSQDRMVPQKPPVWSFKIGDLGISRLEGDIRLFNTILAQWMVPPEFLDPQQFGVLGRHVDIYHAGLLLLGLLMGTIPTFTHDQIVAGEPRQAAEAINSPYGPVIARALRRHVTQRTQSAL
jgi:serine/threonine protein kinase